MESAGLESLVQDPELFNHMALQSVLGSSESREVQFFSGSVVQKQQKLTMQFSEGPLDTASCGWTVLAVRLQSRCNSSYIRNSIQRIGVVPGQAMELATGKNQGRVKRGPRF